MSGSLTNPPLLKWREEETGPQAVDAVDAALSCPSPFSFNRSTAPGGEHFAGFDVVITWVNYTMQTGCNDEMRYLLRSLKTFDMYPDHIRKIFVLVADVHGESCVPLAGPDYLIEGTAEEEEGPLGVHPSLRIVRHSEVFDKANLPTVSRDAILAAVPKIKGLGEWFFRFDDDMTLAKTFDVNDWFDVKSQRMKLHYDRYVGVSSGCEYSGDEKLFPMSDLVGKTQYKRVMYHSNNVLHTKFGPPKNGPGTHAGCRKAPDATDHSALLHNRCIDLIARSMFQKEFKETDKGEEGPDTVHLNTLMVNLAFQMGMGVWVAGGSQWSCQTGHFSMKSCIRSS